MAKRAGRQCIDWNALPPLVGAADIVQVFLNAAETKMIDYARCLFVVSVADPFRSRVDGGDRICTRAWVRVAGLWLPAEARRVAQFRSTHGWCRRLLCQSQSLPGHICGRTAQRAHPSLVSIPPQAPDDVFGMTLQQMNPIDEVQALFKYSFDLHDMATLQPGKLAMLKLWQRKKAMDQQQRHRRGAAEAGNISTIVQYGDYVVSEACEIYLMVASDNFPFKKEALHLMRQVNAANQALKSALNAAKDLAEAAAELADAASACVAMVKEIIEMTIKGGQVGGPWGAVAGFVIGLGKAILTGQAGKCVNGVKKACDKIAAVVDSLEQTVKTWGAQTSSASTDEPCRARRSEMVPSTFQAEFRRLVQDYHVIAEELDAIVSAHLAVLQPLNTTNSSTTKSNQFNGLVGKNARESGIGDMYMQHIDGGGSDGDTQLQNLVQAGSAVQAGRQAVVDAANQLSELSEAKRITTASARGAAQCIIAGDCCASGPSKQLAESYMDEERETQLLEFSVDFLQKARDHFTFATLDPPRPITFRNNRRPTAGELRDLHTAFTLEKAADLERKVRIHLVEPKHAQQRCVRPGNSMCLRRMVNTDAVAGPTSHNRHRLLLFCPRATCLVARLALKRATVVSQCFLV